MVYTLRLLNATDTFCLGLLLQKFISSNSLIPPPPQPLQKGKLQYGAFAEEVTPTKERPRNNIKFAADEDRISESCGKAVMGKKTASTTVILGSRVGDKTKANNSFCTEDEFDIRVE